MFQKTKMLIPTDVSSYEEIIKGSRFLSETFTISSNEDVRNILKSQKQKYKDSTHVCHAFILGKNGEIMGMSDDGEPGGTAGRPILDVLKGKNCTNILLTVTRWFGGILLGTGGLVHAYSGGAKAVLEKTAFEELVEKSSVRLTCDYQQYQIIKKIIEAFTVYDEKEDFSEEILITLKTAVSDFEAFKSKIFNATNGRVLPIIDL